MSGPFNRGEMPHSILISNIRLIGDVILCTPLIALLKKQWPETKIDVLVNRGTGEFLESDPRVNAVIYNEKKDFKAPKNHVHYLKRIFRKYDIAINMNASERGNMAVALAGKKIRLGYRDEEHAVKKFVWGTIFTHHLPVKNDEHVVLRCAQIAAALGLEVNHLHVSMPFTEADQNKVHQVLEQVECRTDYFVVHPFARWEYKYWTPEGFAQCSDHIAQKCGWTPVWTSSPDPKEMEILQSAAQLCQIKPKLLAGRLSIAQMSALLSKAKFYLGLDTAITHIAATYAEHLPMVVLFGPTFYRLWHPWRNAGAMVGQLSEKNGIQINGHILMIQSERFCLPCGKANCDDSGVGKSPCLQEIKAEKVIKAIDEEFLCEIERI